MPKDRMPELLRKLRLFLHRDRFEQDLAEEMRHHLAMKSAAAADSAAAHRQFGNATALQEESRAMWTWTFWEQFVQDLPCGPPIVTPKSFFWALAPVFLGRGTGPKSRHFRFLDLPLTG